ncbi:MAG: Smr/MutS family protein [Rhodobacteraceae bacterium]|nr:Smr/MutS family protein [Paracoccaceae bacterium]
MAGSRKKKRGQLSPEDKELWTKVTKTLTPLHPKVSVETDDEVFSALIDAEAPQPKPSKKPETAIRVQPSHPKVAAVPPLHKLEHRHRKKVVRGVKPIDARIDLHGLTQAQAHSRLSGFLFQAQASGAKLVLVITGKGSGSGPHGEIGILRRTVPQWLSLPEMRSVVIGYEEAHGSHGGAGALYVRIRKKR